MCVVVLAFSAHLSKYPFGSFNSWSGEQGCQVEATCVGMHILDEMESWNTVRSNDMNPSSISSEAHTHTHKEIINK